MSSRSRNMTVASSAGSAPAKAGGGICGATRMKRMIAFAAVLIASLMLGLPSPAAAQCDCANASLMGTAVTTQAGGGPIVNSNVTTNVELPAAGPPLGMAGLSPRMKIDYGVNTIRVDFLQLATYGTNSDFKFGNLNPVPPQGCSGQPKIVNIGVQTNKANAPYVVSSATFGPHNVNVRFGPPTGSIDWKDGEYILVNLKYACDAGPTGGGFDPCCPPWNSKQLQSMLVYQGTGGISAPYTLKFNPSPALQVQMNAYINYLKSLGMGFTSISVIFQVFNAGTGSNAVPIGLPLSTNPVTWTGTGNQTANFFGNGLMQVNQWYRVQTKIVLNGGPGNGFLSEKCFNSYVDVRIQVVPSAFKAGPGRQPAPATMLQMRLEDGTVIEQNVAAASEARD